MQAYRTSTKLKLGLIAAAVAIGVASLLFTQRLAGRLEAQDAAAVELWAEAIAFQGRAGLSAQGAAPWDELAAAVEASGRPAPERARLAAALDSLRDGPPSDGLDFVFSQIVEPQRFSVPAVVTDEATTTALLWRNVADDADHVALAREMDALHAPIPVEVSPGFVQLVHYGESPLARLIRLFPVVQLAVVALFIGVGYLGFSYVRRSEQSSLWVGMAREAAHQLGTPLSSMIGWIELLRLGDSVAPETVADELEQDVERLRRVADRFEKIGSTPDLTPTAVGEVLERVADYIRRRVPTSAPVAITVDVPPDLTAPLNGELFEWVVENLLKNALDALDGAPGPHRIAIAGRAEGGAVVVDVADTGKGMDRATARHVFRPGFSTKRRGWGLGLSLARRIVESYHGGTLAVHETAPGAGTTFRITLARRT
ncbi:HAMP domain-containing sensor histidine kinase [Rubrivirga sp. S365]|uniref:sensor histidine kinase n=1 Tax=Rubrivirga sp. S365 TaxID=3076080 RepID=UPI0028C5E305|nr:HAMP domain-containing sensor histidine kinase [Rubrivirga sp. S365]MDT7856890.1 HAMP domain-containing sensor histidine kinase [Rubrivirga sp. S365]